MTFNLILAALAAVAVGVLPGYFWARALAPDTDLYCTLAFSLALSATLVSAAGLAFARLLGTGVSLPVTVAAALLVAGSGLIADHIANRANRRTGNPAGDSNDNSPEDREYAPIPRRLSGLPRLGVPALSTVAVAGVVILAVMLDLLPEEGTLIPLTGLMVLVAVAQLVADRRAGTPEGNPARQRHLRSLTDRSRPFWGRLVSDALLRAALPVFLLLALVRGYLGPVQYDWPYLRGVDHYSHAVMSNLMLSQGSFDEYLVYPPGFHVMTAHVSNLTALEPLDIFPVLAPAFLMLPVLALYALTSQLWGRGAGVIAAGLVALVGGSSFEYLGDAMYPNLVATQVLLVMALAALTRLFAATSTSALIRSGLLFALLGSSVVLYHSVASLYTALLLGLTSAILLPYLLLRHRRTGITLFLSLGLLGALAVAFAWSTYDLGNTVATLLSGSSDGATGSAVTGAIGTQTPGNADRLLFTTSHYVVWLGLLGGLLMLLRIGALPRSEGESPAFALIRVPLLIWMAMMFTGSRTSLSGFPERFERDLGIPFTVAAAFATATIAHSLWSTRSNLRRENGQVSGGWAGSLAAATTLSVLVAVGTLQLISNHDRADSINWNLIMTPDIEAAGDFLQENNTGGRIMVGPHINQVPGRVMLAEGRYSGLEAFPEPRIDLARDLPPYGPDPLRDVLFVTENPGEELTEDLIEGYDIRYIVFYKQFPEGSFWETYDLIDPDPYREYPELYRTAFENEDVVIFQPLANASANASAG